MSYFESHITIEPVSGDRLDLFLLTAKSYNFKVAGLLMVKDRAATEERSNKDSFCTGHGKDFLLLLSETRGLVGALESQGLKVWRYKIESVIVDVHFTREYSSASAS